MNKIKVIMLFLILILSLGLVGCSRIAVREIEPQIMEADHHDCAPVAQLPYWKSGWIDPDRPF